MGLEHLLASNPCVKFHHIERGYIRCSVTPDRWQAEIMVADYALQLGGKNFARRSLVIEAGDPKVLDT